MCFIFMIGSTFTSLTVLSNPGYTKDKSMNWPILHFYKHLSICSEIVEVQYSTVQNSTVQYSTVQYSTVQYSTVQYSTVQYSTVQYSTVSAVDLLIKVAYFVTKVNIFIIKSEDLSFVSIELLCLNWVYYWRLIYKIHKHYN